MAELRFISLASKNSLCIPRGRWERITISRSAGKGRMWLIFLRPPTMPPFLLPPPSSLPWSIRLSERSPYLWARPTSWMLSLDTRNRREGSTNGCGPGSGLGDLTEKWHDSRLWFSLGLPLPTPSRAPSTLEDSAPSLLKCCRKGEDEAAMEWEDHLYSHVHVLWGKSLIAEFDVMDSNHVNVTKFPFTTLRGSSGLGSYMKS